MSPAFRKAGLALAGAWMATGVVAPLLFSPPRMIVLALWCVPLMVCTLAWGHRALGLIAGPGEQAPL